MGDALGVSDKEQDIAILRRLARGEQAALGELYDIHAPRLTAIAIRLLGSESEAEDVLHDVFVEVWKRAGDYDPERGTVRTWIAMRLRSRCLDRLRSPSRRGQLLEEQHMGSGEMRLDLDGPRLQQALSALPSPQRDVLCMAYFDGLSGPEISEALSIPLGTVKSRIAAGLEKLRSALAPRHAESAR
ncbi:MAG: sigma-70 family RNA polymerase sigma factor [Myxococcota bacterium]